MDDANCNRNRRNGHITGPSRFTTFYSLFRHHHHHHHHFFIWPISISISTSIQLRRAGQQRPTRTPTAGLKHQEQPCHTILATTGLHTDTHARTPV